MSSGNLNRFARSIVPACEHWYSRTWVRCDIVGRHEQEHKHRPTGQHWTELSHYDRVGGMPAPPTCCEHGNHPDDVVCCICSNNPCDHALDNRARRVVEHHMQELQTLRDVHEREIAYVEAHGKRQELPF